MATGIDLQIRFVPVNVLTNMARPCLFVDDDPVMKPGWGRTFLPLEPGSHQIRCFLTVMGLGHFADSILPVDVPESGVLKVLWSPPLNAYRPGKWSYLDPSDSN
jgi:hypothetical protein